MVETDEGAGLNPGNVPNVATATTQNPVIATAFPSPRVGGGNDSTAWTGGPNDVLKRLTRPSSTMARRPTDFKSASSIEHIATKGLPEDRHIGPDEKTSKITLTSWVNSIRSYMEERGMDTVFYVFDPVTNSEIYLLSEWGSASPTKIDAWVTTLRSGVPKPDGTLLPVCDYDGDNLKWSGKAILSSITLALWETVEKDLGVDASGPEAFASVISKLQQVNSAAIRSLVDELKSLSLIKEPGQDVEIFGGRVIELCRRITGTGLAPTDLGVLAAATFLNCDVLSFKLKAIAIHDMVDDNPLSMNWDAVVRTLKTKYQSLKGQSLWTPQASTKKRDDEISGLHVAINKLSARINSGTGGGGGKATPDTRCYECGKTGHFAKDCPKRNTSTSGLRTPPATGQAQVKMIDGASHSWCSICRRWMTGAKEHVTSKHVRGKERNPEETPTPEAEPVVAALAVAEDVAEGTPYNGGGLHLHGGLFVAQFSEHTGSNDTASTSPAAASTICQDDFFHVAGQVESHESDLQSASPAPSTGLPRLLTGKASEAQPSSHRIFGIYALSSSSGSPEVSTASEMNTLLTRVALRRDPSSSDRESWVNAVTRKLCDIGILTVPVFLSEIKTINSRLEKVGHTMMNNSTLDMLAREAVNLRNLEVEPTSSSPIPGPTPLNDEMGVFLRRVALAKKISPSNVGKWVTSVRFKLYGIGVHTVRDVVSEIIMLNRKLSTAGKPMMHYQTLDLMARHGVDIMLDPQIEFPPAQPDFNSPFEQGQCLACDETGPLYHLCASCEDSGLIYDKIQASPDSSTSSSEPIGTCSGCNTAGPVGQPCITCPDRAAMYLNFHAGL
jgi:hypothetical protein